MEGSVLQLACLSELRLFGFKGKFNSSSENASIHNRATSLKRTTKFLRYHSSQAEQFNSSLLHSRREI
ncbi:hypothetical protein HNY73_010754 [Argiope bruennichi]|uniref:Uncharacterized protein n=1 Tax=Argiope bruennichi TaxID=94029 RepID=A0A8T0F6Y0_ARGBR|nr:hypothetical protein HNY73_010754 [Argiope bruennichi]